MKKTVCLAVIILMLAVMLGCTQYHAQGAGVGGAIGGIAGALLDKKNPWRGGVIGAVLGGIAGAAITDIAMQASKQAAATGKPVEYKTEDGSKWVRAEPAGYNAVTKCKKTRLRQWENGNLSGDEIKEICDAEETTNKY